MATMVKQRAKNGYTAPGNRSYDGTAARRLEGRGTGGSQVLQPRPQVRPRRGAVARPQVRGRAAGRVAPAARGGCLAIGALAVMLLMGYVRLAQLSDEVVDLQAQMVTLQSDEAKLRAKYELAYDLSDIEKTVTADGSMVRPQENQICYVDLSQPDSVERFDTGSGTGGSGFLDSVKEIVSTVVEYFR